MRIINIMPGTGGTFYCENCLRDASLMDGLKKRGHEAIMIPMYLPILMNEPGMNGEAPVFFGAINVYLKQQFPLYRKVPRWLERLLDASPLLNLAAKKSGSTSAKGLEEMTLSMLRGEDGNQATELNALITWLKEHEKPDVIHLANALLLGLARRMKQELDVPVVCSLQDEHTWLDQMDEKYASILWDTMSERAQDVDAFIAVSQYYANLMQKRMKVPAEKMFTVLAGINLDGFEQTENHNDTPVIGYLSRMCETHGLDILVEAFIQVRKNKKLKSTKLYITGGELGEDKGFIKKLNKKLKECNCRDDVLIFPEFDRPNRIQFLKSLTLLSVPMHEPEALGVFQIEAMAAGVPVVQPNIGGFKELIETTKGGVLYEPNSPAELARQLEKLLLDPGRIRELAVNGRKAVFEKYSGVRMAEEIVKIYEGLNRG